jgi:flavin reductase (DIM6/NTAB) family NADH-FMN oxidoreductase RutF
LTGIAPQARVEEHVFRQVMGALAAGVAIVTTLDLDGQPRGLTTTAVTSVSLDPPLLLVCVGRQSRTLPAIQQTGCFVVNLIDSAFSAVALHFASALDDKFAAMTWRPAANGCPVLHEHSVAWAECRTENEIEAGDHVVFVGHVEAGALADGSGLPLTYVGGRYGDWSPLELPGPDPVYANLEGEVAAR